jgi:choline dehydrogenase-like flavoprotein
MICDAYDVPRGTNLTCDVVIVGSGAGGMTVARELLDSQFDVIVLEAGGYRNEKATQDLYRGHVVKPGPSPLHRHRLRRFGGTTAVWGGRCAPLESVDFERREFVPYSGWPLSRDDLDRYYQRAHEHCECGRYVYDARQALPQGGKTLIPGFESDDLDQNGLWRFSLPTDFGKRSKAVIKDSSRVRVYLHANCLGLLTGSDGRHIVGVRAASLGRNEFVVRAKYFVLAAGCLETARLLLVSRDVWTSGVGNQNDLVGRFYSGHLTGDLCTATFTPKGGDIIWNYERTPEGVYCRRTLTIRQETFRREQLHSFRCTLTHLPIPDATHRNAVLSAAYLVKHFFVDKIPPEFSKALAETKYRDVGAHVRNVILGLPSLAAFSVGWARWRILARRKMPSIAFRSPTNSYSLHYDAEQSPNPDNRVTLSDDRDVLNLPRLRVDWRGQERDFESVVRCFQILQRAFEKSGVGSMNASVEDVRKRVRSEACVGAHQFGATRMAGDPTRGVVDANCRVYGTENLFIATSSIFPTVGYANPVLTITALAIRLADHLKQLATRQAPDVQPSEPGRKTFSDLGIAADERAGAS